MCWSTVFVFVFVFGFKCDIQVEKVAASDEAQYQPPSELEPGQVHILHRNDTRMPITITK